MDLAIQPNGIKPEQPLEPPKEVKDMTFNFNPDVLSGDGGATTITDGHGQVIKEEPKSPVEGVVPVGDSEAKGKANKEEAPPKPETVPAPKKETTQPEPKKESLFKAPKETSAAEKVLDPVPPKKEVPSGDKPLIKPITLGEKKQEQEPIDYSKFSQDEVRELKQMSNQAKVFTAKLIEENRDLKKVKDSTYLQHEEAYVLDPGFKETQAGAYLAQTEAQAWENALIAIKDGNPFVQPIGRDPKTGALIFSKEMQADTRDELRISQNLQACLNEYRNRTGQLQQYPVRYKQQIQQDLQVISDVRKSMFAWQADPKLMEFSIPTENGDKKVKEIIGDFKNKFPAYMRSHPAVDAAADLMCALVYRTAELNEALKGKGAAEIKEDEARRAEPSSDARETGAGFTQVNGHKIPQTFSMEGLDKIRGD